ncbi:MAG: alginate export family protein [Polyangiales bacterium]
MRFVPQASGIWGVGGDTLDDAALNLHEGYIAFGRASFQLQIGRMELAYGDHLVLGNVDWHPTGRSFDALRLRLLRAKFDLDVFASLVSEGGTPNFFDGDFYLLGAYAMLGRVFARPMDFDVYWLAQLRDGDPSNSVNSVIRFTLGARAKNRVGDFDYRFETDLQTGKNASNAIIAGQADLEAGYNFFSDRFRAALEGAFASGDNPNNSRDSAYDQLYPTAHKWMGFSDIIGARSNVLTGIAHLSSLPHRDFKLYLDAHVFARPQPSMDYAGTELDVGAIYTIATGLKTRVGYALFVGNENVYPNIDTPAHFLEMELRYDY